MGSSFLQPHCDFSRVHVSIASVYMSRIGRCRIRCWQLLGHLASAWSQLTRRVSEPLGFVLGFVIGYWSRGRCAGAFGGSGRCFQWLTFTAPPSTDHQASPHQYPIHTGSFSSGQAMSTGVSASGISREQLRQRVSSISFRWSRIAAPFITLSPEPVGAGNGGLAGSFASVVFSIVMGFRAVPDLYRYASPFALCRNRRGWWPPPSEPSLARQTLCTRA
jgi:hypothetical protein